MNEKIIEKIRKLLEMTEENGCTEAEEGWLEKSKNFRHKTARYNQSYDRDSYEKGRTDGRATANARSLEGGE